MLHRREGQRGQGGKMGLAAAGGTAKEGTDEIDVVGALRPITVVDAQEGRWHSTSKQQDVETLLRGEGGPLHPKTSSKPCDEIVALLVVAGAGKKEVGLRLSSIQVTVATEPLLRGQGGSPAAPQFNLEVIGPCAKASDELGGEIIGSRHHEVWLPVDTAVAEGSVGPQFGEVVQLLGPHPGRLGPDCTHYVVTPSSAVALV